MATQIEIKRGDTLSGLAQQHGTTVDDFQRANPNITDPNLIRAGESLNLPGQTQSFSDNVIDAERVASEQPLSTPQVQEPTGERAIEEVLAEGRRSTQQIVEQRAQEATRETDTSRTQLQERVSDILGLQQERISAEEEAGVPQMTQQLAEMASQIEAKEHQMRRMIEEIQDTPGISQAQANRRIAEVQRQSARELADLSIVHNAKLRNLEATQAAIDRRINLELEGLQFQLQFDQMFYQENRQRMTQAEDQQFQLMLQQEEREYQSQLREKEQIGQVAMTAAQYGAGPDEIEQIFSADNFAQAVSRGSQSLGAAFQFQVESQKFAQQIQREQMSIAYKQLSLQEQQMANSAQQTFLAMSKDARDELQKTRAYENYEVRSLIANDLDNTLNEFAGTAERDQVDWNSLAKNDSAVNAIATQLVYSRNPQLRRAVDLGDSEAAADVLSQAKQTVESLRVGRNIDPAFLKDRTREIDTNYRSSTKAYNRVVDDILARVPGAVLPEYNVAQVRDSQVTKDLNDLIETTSSGDISDDWQQFIETPATRMFLPGFSPNR
jgi:LysM repeat protein